MEDANVCTDDDHFGLVGLSQRGPHGTRVALTPSSYILTPRLLLKSERRMIAPPIRPLLKETSNQLKFIESKLCPVVAFQKKAYIEPSQGDLASLKKANLDKDADLVTFKPMTALKLDPGHDWSQLDGCDMPEFTPASKRMDGSLPRMANQKHSGQVTFNGLKHFSDYVIIYRSAKKQKDNLQHAFQAKAQEVTHYSLRQYRNREKNQHDKKSSSSKPSKSILKKKIVFPSRTVPQVPSPKEITTSSRTRKVVFSPEITIFLFYKTKTMRH